jgi:hypothetical protein
MPNCSAYLYLEFVLLKLPHLACVIEGDGVIVTLDRQQSSCNGTVTSQASGAAMLVATWTGWQVLVKGQHPNMQYSKENPKSVLHAQALTSFHTPRRPSFPKQGSTPQGRT